MKKSFIKMSDEAVISIAEHSNTEFTLCVLYNPFPNLQDKWEIDSEIYEVGSSMEVYGLINEVIQPEWYEYTGFNKL